jgi:hypothetical protein
MNNGHNRIVTILPERTERYFSTALARNTRVVGTIAADLSLLYNGHMLPETVCPHRRDKTGDIGANNNEIVTYLYCIIAIQEKSQIAG